MNSKDVFRDIADNLTMYQLFDNHRVPYDSNGCCKCPDHRGDDKNCKILKNGKIAICYSHHCEKGSSPDVINWHCRIKYNQHFKNLPTQQKPEVLKELCSMAGLDYSDYSQQHSKQQLNFEGNKSDVLISALGLEKETPPVSFAETAIRGIKTTRKNIALTSYPRLGITKILMPGTYNIIAGTPGSSKTFLAQDFLLNCLGKNINCRLLPLESDHEFLALRFAAMLSKSFDPLLTPDDCVDAEERAIAAVDSVENELNFIEPAVCINPLIPDKSGNVANVDVDYMINWMKFQFEKGVQVLIIDNMTMISFDPNNVYESQGEFIRKITGLVDQYKGIVILICHTTKRIEGKASLGDIAGTSLIGKLASTVLLLESHPEKYSQIHRADNSTVDASHNRTIHILKARNGQGDGMQIAFDFGRNGANFEEIGFIKPKN